MWSIYNYLNMCILYIYIFRYTNLNVYIEILCPYRCFASWLSLGLFMSCFVCASSLKFAPNYVCHLRVSPHILFVQDSDRNIICPSTGFECIQLYI